MQLSMHRSVVQVAAQSASPTQGASFAHVMYDPQQDDFRHAVQVLSPASAVQVAVPPKAGLVPPDVVPSAPPLMLPNSPGPLPRPPPPEEPLLSVPVPVAVLLHAATLHATTKAEVSSASIPDSNRLASNRWSMSTSSAP
jgi:hypothetical protein